jgi:hypothetical protein
MNGVDDRESSEENIYWREKNSSQLFTFFGKDFRTDDPPAATRNGRDNDKRQKEARQICDGNCTREKRCEVICGLAKQPTAELALK